jgi:hypothetical protein
MIDPTNDRTGGCRSDDLEDGQGLASPPCASRETSMRNEIRRGYGNDALMEITKRFPQALGNLAENARFPHSHSRSSSCQIRKKTEHVNHASHTKNLTRPAEDTRVFGWSHRHAAGHVRDAEHGGALLVQRAGKGSARGTHFRTWAERFFDSAAASGFGNGRCDCLVNEAAPWRVHRPFGELPFGKSSIEGACERSVNNCSRTPRTKRLS